MLRPQSSAVLDVTIVGGGMITGDQILPTIYQLQREGSVGEIHVCALDTPPLQALKESTVLSEAFPGQDFISHPAASEPPERKFPTLYKEVLRGMKRRQAVIVAMPDPLHHEVVMEALGCDQHVLCVKPLVLTYAHAEEISATALHKGLFVGVEYHKRFDRRALLARRQYRQGHFGEFIMGEARMIEPYSYRFSNFQNWFTCDQTDPFTYVGCHYLDLVHFITDLRPVEVSVSGCKGRFPNGNEGYLWANSRVRWENGAILTQVNGLGYPDRAAGSNMQGLTLYCEGQGKSGYLEHEDQFRGVTYCYVEGIGLAGSHYNNIHPDFFRLVPWDGPGYRAVGYGCESIEANLEVMARMEAETAGLPEVEALARRQAIIHEVDARGIIATPANSYVNELATEAARLSIARDGEAVRIVYGDPPQVTPRHQA